jgi:hypothetical protein
LPRNPFLQFHYGRGFLSGTRRSPAFARPSPPSGRHQTPENVRGGLREGTQKLEGTSPRARHTNGTRHHANMLDCLTFGETKADRGSAVTWRQPAHHVWFSMNSAYALLVTAVLIPIASRMFWRQRNREAMRQILLYSNAALSRSAAEHTSRTARGPRHHTPQRRPPRNPHRL